MEGGADLRRDIQPGADWHYLQVVKERCGSRLVAVHTQVIYGDPRGSTEGEGFAR